MPGPDPQGIDIAEYDDGAFALTAEIWWYGNRTARLARMFAIRRRIDLDGWRCEWCGGPVPLYRRADARYCREACRKHAARRRRKCRNS